MKQVIEYYPSRDNNVQTFKRGTLVEVHISDIHFGALDSKYQYDTLNSQFLEVINTVHFDILSIDGDLFDHKFLSNSDAIMYATMFINRCVAICKQKNATLVLIHGTNEHDANQLKLFYHYLNDNELDIRIVEHAKFEYIKGAKILCIPEEYGKGKEYYENLLYSGIYDGVFMHGTYKNAIYGKNEEDLDSSREPVFSMNNFSLCRSAIISGHVHTAGCYDKYFYYNGSPLRWRFGEEEDKGFSIVLRDLDTGAHYFEFFPIISERYDTINLDHMLMEDPKHVIEHVKNLQANGIHNIRIEFTIDNEENLNIIKSYYKNNGTVKIKADVQKTKQDIQAEQILTERYKEYDYIMDKNLSEYEILTRYINQNKGYAYITTDELIAILNEM